MSPDRFEGYRGTGLVIEERPRGGMKDAKNMLLMREDVIAVADFGAAHATINTVL